MGVEPFTAEIAEHHADIFAELAQTGTMIPSNDIAVRCHRPLPRLRRARRPNQRSSLPPNCRTAGEGVALEERKSGDTH